MKNVSRYFLTRLGFGLLFVAPVYLAILLILKALGSIRELLQPIKLLMPAWLQSESLLALIFLIVILFIVGVLVQTRVGQRARGAIERTTLQRIPGYSMFQSLTKRIASETVDITWKPALVETDDNALMPVFIIEELPDGRYTVFIPSVPTPLAGNVLIYQRERVHLVNVPFSQALKVVSHWGEGSKDLVAAMEQERR